MKRSSMQKVYVRPPRVLPAVPAEPPPLRSVMVRIDDGKARAVMPKDARAMQSDADQKRLYGHVASLECGRCWRHGRTQVSHSNQLIDGKGRGLKAQPWRIAALCDECHAMIDQGKDMSKEERRQAWNDAHRWTLGELFARGLVRPT